MQATSNMLTLKARERSDHLLYRHVAQISQAVTDIFARKKNNEINITHSK